MSKHKEAAYADFFSEHVWWVFICIAVVITLLSNIGPISDAVAISALDNRHTVPMHRAEMATVTIRFNVDADTHGGATGVFIDKARGLILTARHVVRDPDSGQMYAHLQATTRTGEKLKLRVLFFSQVADIAVVQVVGKVPEDVTQMSTSCSVPKAGDKIAVLGQPLLQLFYSWSFGHVSSNIHYQGYVMMDMTVLPGNSGGPVFNDNGKVVGVVSILVPWGYGMGGGASGFSGFTPVARLCSILPKL